MSIKKEEKIKNFPDKVSLKRSEHTSIDHFQLSILKL